MKKNNFLGRLRKFVRIVIKYYRLHRRAVAARSLEEVDLVERELEGVEQELRALSPATFRNK